MLTLLVKQGNQWVPFVDPFKKLTKAETIKNYRREIIGLLQDFASEEWKKEEWVGKNKKIIYPSEPFSMWFDDLVRDVYWLMREKILTKDEAVILKPFHEMLHNFIIKFQDDYIHKRKKALMSDYKNWVEVQEKAKETLQKLGWGN